MRPRLRFSTFFLDIEAGFDNVDAPTPRSSLMGKEVYSKMVNWVSPFVSERSGTLVFQRSHNLQALLSVDTPQLCLIFTTAIPPLCHPIKHVDTRRDYAIRLR